MNGRLFGVAVLLLVGPVAETRGQATGAPPAALSLTNEAAPKTAWPAVSQFQVNFSNLAAPSRQVVVPVPPLPPATSSSRSLPAPPAPPPLTALAFDAESKDYEARVGEENAPFIFNVTNVSGGDVSITGVRTSCGCTVAQLPSMPWKLAPGASGPIKVAMDLRGKRGLIIKSVNIDTTAGYKSLMVRVNVPDLAVTNNIASLAMLAGERQRNQVLALGDRQAVFKGDCARCHLDPARAKLGPALYFSACAICHDAISRAAMVPDLRQPRTHRNVDYWRQWINHGKPGTLMPAWAASTGGPLSLPQVDSLVDYLYQSFPRTPVPVKPLPLPGSWAVPPLPASIPAGPGPSPNPSSDRVTPPSGLSRP